MRLGARRLRRAAGAGRDVELPRPYAPRSRAFQRDGRRAAAPGEGSRGRRARGRRRRTVDELEAAVDGAPAARRSRARRDAARAAAAPTGSSATSRGSSAASRAGARAWPASSTGCSACSSAWGYVDGWALTDARASCSPGSTPRPTSCSPSRSARACSTGSSAPETRRGRVVLHLRAARPRRRRARCRRRAGRRREVADAVRGDRAALARPRVAERGRRRLPETRAARSRVHRRDAYEWARATTSPTSSRTTR